jgi:GT2 family glycosyltransferase
MSITVVLSLYKRPHVLIEQLTSMDKQTVKPTKILIWRTILEDIPMPTIPENLMTNVAIIESKENFGVWGRFAIAFLTNTEYVCVIDDDTIPMSKWFENCLNTIKEFPGLLGTNGNIFNKGDTYKIEKQIGWHSANEKTTEVDFVGHSWFFKREWLHHLWELNPDIYGIYLKSGEDMGFSAMLQKHGIKTYVPPHPENDKELWGSNPELGEKYGTESVGISMTSDSQKFNDTLKDLISKGYITINNRNLNKGGYKRRTNKNRKNKMK